MPASTATGTLVASMLVLAMDGGAEVAANNDSSLARSVDHYNVRYPRLTSPFTSEVDDLGNGDPRLSGTRNFRVVLSGILYRGGANRSYGAFKLPKPARSGPLQDFAVRNLCAEGFSGAVYAYGKNTFRSDISCESQGAANAFDYRGLRPQSSPSDRRAFLQVIHDRIVGADHRPVFVHCWNGYHASGAAAAIALRQFCEISPGEAVAYWRTDAQPLPAKKLAIVLKQIRNFTPIPELAISPAQQKIVCYGGAYNGKQAVWHLPKEAVRGSSGTK